MVEHRHDILLYDWPTYSEKSVADPVRPGDFSAGEMLIACHTSSSVKGLSRSPPCTDGKLIESQPMVTSLLTVVPMDELKWSWIAFALSVCDVAMKFLHLREFLSMTVVLHYDQMAYRIRKQ